MKLLSICDPTRYGSPPLDVPTFYQRLSQDESVSFYHLPSPKVISTAISTVISDVSSIENSEPFTSFPIEQPYVPAIPSSSNLTYDEFLALGDRPSESIALADIDLVFCRTLKPFPAGYLNRLAEWEKYTRFVNSPTGKQTQMRSDFLLEVAEGYIPDAITTSHYDHAIAFFEQHKTIVAKQSNSCGGRGVFKIWYQAGVFYVDNVLSGTRQFPTFARVMSFLQQGQNNPLQFCRYLHRTDEGDKRVVVVDGEIYGSYLRRSRSGHWVNNVSLDGECTLADITEDEIAAIRHTVGRYRALGLHTLGYDFLMDDDGTWRISEINAGNIGGFARLELLTGKPIMGRLTDWLKVFSQRPLSTTTAFQDHVHNNLQFA